MAFPDDCPQENGPRTQNLPGPQLTEYKENSDGEQDHSKHQSPDPQALVICGEDTQRFLRGSGEGAASVAPHRPRTPIPVHPDAHHS